MVVAVQDDPGRLSVTVTDRGPAAGPALHDVAGGMLDGDPDEDEVDPDVALALVSGLVDDVDVESGPGGTAVRMRWSLARTLP